MTGSPPGWSPQSAAGSAAGTSGYTSSGCSCPHRLVPQDAPVAERDDAAGLQGDVAIVGHHDQRLMVALVGELEQRDDLLGIVAVQVAGRLVGQHQGGGS